MSQQNTVKFATFGPNRGLSFFIGSHEFVEGICEVPEQAASSASSILTRYYDVCYEHELAQKIAEYDAAQQNREAAKSSNPQLETTKTPPAVPEKAQNLESGQALPPQTETQNEPPAPDTANASDAVPDAKKNGTGKKQNGKN